MTLKVIQYDLHHYILTVSFCKPLCYLNGGQSHPETTSIMIEIFHRIKAISQSNLCNESSV